MIFWNLVKKKSPCRRQERSKTPKPWLLDVHDFSWTPMRLRHWNFKLGALRMEASLRDFYKKATKMWGPQDVLHYLFSHQNDIQNAKTIDMILQHSLWLVTSKTLCITSYTFNFQPRTRWEDQWFFVSVLGLWLRVQESLTLESRSKSIPFPKAKSTPKAAASKGKAKAKAKSRAEPEEPDDAEEPPSVVPKRRAAKGKGKWKVAFIYVPDRTCRFWKFCFKH